MKYDAFRTALNAMSNASSEPVDEKDVGAIIATGDGPGNFVRALFGDCAFETLDRIAARLGRTPAQLMAAYRAARCTHAAANAELDDVDVTSVTD